MDAQKLLAKQIKKHFSAKQIEQTPGLSDFINAVQESYSNFEHNRKMSEHAFSISEMEYREINEKLNKEKETIERGVIRLSNMIRAIAIAGKRHPCDHRPICRQCEKRGVGGDFHRH